MEGGGVTLLDRPPSHYWNGVYSDIEQKQRIQKLLWPKGAKIEKDNNRTPETPDILKLLNYFDDDNPNMVAPRGIELRYIPPLFNCCGFVIPKPFIQNHRIKGIYISLPHLCHEITPSLP